MSRTGGHSAGRCEGHRRDCGRAVRKALGSWILEGVSPLSCSGSRPSRAWILRKISECPSKKEFWEDSEIQAGPHFIDMPCLLSTSSASCLHCLRPTGTHLISQPFPSVALGRWPLPLPFPDSSDLLVPPLLAGQSGHPPEAPRPGGCSPGPQPASSCSSGAHAHAPSLGSWTSHPCGSWLQAQAAPCVPNNYLSPKPSPVLQNSLWPAPGHAPPPPHHPPPRVPLYHHPWPCAQLPFPPPPHHLTTDRQALNPG